MDFTIWTKWQPPIECGWDRRKLEWQHRVQQWQFTIRAEQKSGRTENGSARWTRLYAALQQTGQRHHFQPGSTCARDGRSGVEDRKREWRRRDDSNQ